MNKLMMETNEELLSIQDQEKVISEIIKAIKKDDLIYGKNQWDADQAQEAYYHYGEGYFNSKDNEKMRLFVQALEQALIDYNIKP